LWFGRETITRRREYAIFGGESLHTLEIAGRSEL
jgi:hypothetical protein